MEYLTTITIFFCFLSFNSFGTIGAALDQTDLLLQTYIVHIESPNTQQTLTDSPSQEDTDLEIENWYRSFLPATTTNSNGNENEIVYSYRHVFKGFAAKLSPDQIKEMEKKDGFISARPEKVISVHTTHSPNFLGLQQNLGFWNASNYGRGIIIGLLDSGILPDHPSFSDDGIPPPPAKWKGRCEFNSSINATCNNKLIGARYFRSVGMDSPLDGTGHGTHTASTAAGNFVTGANVYGNANGTAAGIAPLAHVAMYKVCATSSCSESDIIAAMDAAIEDGVDVLSISLGGGFSSGFYDDNIALGAFSAMEKGIFVSCSAGNSGPFSGSLSNEAPWILTVGASTIDRKLKSTAVLGNGEQYDGESVFQPIDFHRTQLPLVYPALLNASDFYAPFCDPSSLNNTSGSIRGMIVVCLVGGGVSRSEKGQAVKDAGGAAMILVNPASWANTTLAEVHVIPTIHVCYVDGQKILAYVINSTRPAPTAAILFNGTVIGDVRAPVVAGFSSRGPSGTSPGILKPDIIGPGVNILAAWPISVENITGTKSSFNIVSGTSMSCPHLSGVAALLKNSHPDWSPAIIKSAIMTTADIINLDNRPIEDERFLPASYFATGAGHVNPLKANDPGLVHDIQPEDYVPYLCGLNYTNRQIGIILQRRVNCTDAIPEAQLNYPSFSVRLGLAPQTYTRTVTNVGDAVETYGLQILSPPDVNVTVEPSTLSFTEINQKLAYQVTFERQIIIPNNTYVQGSLIWSSVKHVVRTPIMVRLF